MKRILYISFAVLLLVNISGCDDYTKSYNVPPPSTVANFTYESATGFAPPDTISFINQSIVPEIAGEATYHWSFGDGASSNEENPTHIYAENGNYEVELTVETSVSMEVRTKSELLVLLSGDSVLFEDFEERNVMPHDWVLVNVDQNIPDNPNYASLADSAWIVDYSTTFEGNVALGLSFYLPEAAADDWMILPIVSLTDDPILSWDAMSLTTSGNYPDSYQIFVSTTTQTVDGCLANGVFYRVVGESWSENADTPGEGIKHRQISLSTYANQDVFIAFRLMTPFPGGDRLAIDNILILNQ